MINLSRTTKIKASLIASITLTMLSFQNCARTSYINPSADEAALGLVGDGTVIITPDANDNGNSTEGGLGGNGTAPTTTMGSTTTTMTPPPPPPPPAPSTTMAPPPPSLPPPAPTTTLAPPRPMATTTTMAPPPPSLPPPAPTTTLAPPKPPVTTTTMPGKKNCDCNYHGRDDDDDDCDKDDDDDDHEDYGKTCEEAYKMLKHFNLGHEIPQNGSAKESKGHILLLGDKVAKISNLRGKTVIIGKSDTSKVEELSHIRGKTLVCGMDIGNLIDVRGKVLVINADIGNISDVRGTVRLINGKVTGKVENVRGKLRVNDLKLYDHQKEEKEHAH